MCEKQEKGEEGWKGMKLKLPVEKFLQFLF